MNDQLADMIATIKSAAPQPIPEELNDLDGVIGAAYTHAKEVLVDSESDTQLAPSWLMLTENGQMIILVTPFFDEPQKELIAGTMREVMRECGVIRYAFSSEAWVIRQTPEERRLDPRPPAQREDRSEVVMIVAGDRRGQNAIENYEIVRDWTTGKISELKTLDKGEGRREGAVVSGRFANLLR